LKKEDEKGKGQKDKGRLDKTQNAGTKKGDLAWYKRFGGMKLGRADLKIMLTWNLSGKPTRGKDRAGEKKEK